jgi:Family of unknown function (DUF5691)
MAGLKPLLPLALLGTERGPWPGWDAAWPAPLRATLDDAATPRDALALLRCAAVLATCAQAAGPAPAPTLLPTPAPEETWDVLPDERLARAVLALWPLPAPQRLWHELFGQLAARRWRLPHRWLPRALQLAARHELLREPMLPVLGERGRWLAALGRAESAAGEPEAIWSHGSWPERLALLRAERHNHPAQARERLQSSWRELPAKEREELLALFADLLGPDDEALLEMARADRAQGPRQQALTLLLRLPQAAYTQRACARLAACLRQEKKGFFGGQAWVIEPPEQAPSDAAAEQIEAALPKGESVGLRAWWLLQLVRQVPLAWWHEHTGMDAPALRRWAEKTDWAEPLLRGWREALVAAPHADWAEHWLADWPKAAGTDGMAELLRQLPVAQRERHWRTLAAGTQQHQLLAQLQPGETLSQAFSNEQLPLLMQCLREPGASETYLLRSIGADWLAALHPNALRELSRRLPGWQQLNEAQAHPLLAAVAEARLALHTLTPESSP